MKMLQISPTISFEIHSDSVGNYCSGPLFKKKLQEELTPWKYKEGWLKMVASNAYNCSYLPRMKAA